MDELIYLLIKLLIRAFDPEGRRAKTDAKARDAAMAAVVEQDRPGDARADRRGGGGHAQTGQIRQNEASPTGSAIARASSTSC